MSWKKAILYLLFGLLMLGIISEKIIRAELALRHGTEFRCTVTGFDPPDFLRGRYVRFHTAPVNVAGKQLVAYVTLSTGADGMVKYGETLDSPPQIGDYLKLRREKPWKAFTLPFDSFYVNERRAASIDRALREKGRGTLIFRVLKGYAVPVDLLIDGKSVRGTIL